MVITRVAPFSAAKIVGALYALLGLLFGGVVSLAALAGAFAAPNEPGAFFGALFGVGAIVLLPLFYGGLGFVMTFLTAWLYNIVSGMVGGVEIDVR